MTAKFLANPKGFCSTYSVLVLEPIPGGLKPTAAPNTRQVMATLATCGNYIFPFSFAAVPGTSKTVALTINPNPATPGLPTCYFLPYQQNACTEMQIDTAADWCFTSMLSGCSVQVHGTATQPTIAHANGADVYSNAYAGGEAIAKTNGLTDAKAIHNSAETAANGIAQGHITGLLPNTGGAASGVVTKMDYLNRLTKQYIKDARKNYKLGLMELFWEFKPGTIGQKPKMGSFVFGRRDATKGWRFYYQSTVALKAKTTLGKQIDDEIVLGPVQKFFG